jgi:hypothetical protein
MEVDLLVNPNIVAGTATLETVDIPTLTFDDPPAAAAPPPPPPPKLVPSLEETGPVKLDGFDNFNAEPYAPAPTKTVRMSEDAVLKEKYELLRKFERLSKLGVPMRKRFTIDSPLEEMKMELEFIKREKAMDSTIKQFSEWFVTGMSALEWGSKNVTMLRAFGLQLDGLSESAQMNVADLEDDFEELYDLYGENMKMHPLVKIPLRVCMMVYMVHLTNQMTRKAPIPNIDEIMRQNPDIARQLASAAMQTQMRGSAAPPAPTAQASPNNPLSGLMSFMQGAIPPGPPPQVVPNVIPRAPAESKPIQIGVQKKSAMKAPAPPPAATAVQMRPPPSIDDLLKDIKATTIPPEGRGPPPPEKISKPGKNKAGSTGKNSVVIKL